jgi:hypothetical protein
MPITVTIPGVGDVDFPDTMPQAVVDAKAKELYDQARQAPTGQQGPSALLQAPPRLTGPDPRGDQPTIASGILHAPGTGESLATLPLVAANFVPGLNIADKPITIPLAAALGGLGEAGEQAVTSKPWSLNDIMGAAIRQGGLEATGRTIAAGGRPLMSMFGVPGASKSAVTAAIDEGIGRNLNKAQEVASGLSGQIQAKVAPMSIPIDEALAPAGAAVNRAVTRSSRPLDTYAALQAEEAAIRGQNAPVWSGAEALAKKQGAGEGYESIMRKQLQGQMPAPPSLMEESLRRGLQAAMETRDPAIGPLNQRLGNVVELIKYLKPEQQKEAVDTIARLATRGAIGAGVGGALGSAFDEKGPGAMLGAVMAASPTAGAITARGVKAAGELLPPLVRGTSLVIPSIRRRVLGTTPPEEAQ